MQMVAYLLISSSSVGIEAIRQAETSSPLWKAAIILLSQFQAAFAFSSQQTLQAPHIRRPQFPSSQASRVDQHNEHNAQSQLANPN
ncbi:hypothetical protein SAY86_029382 [Trapa natans]|uniref:Uncharacterized protein n=1 Tax=Trapa natans TaxID=22666 RepID=A0AAN7RFZ3_TRANT|nr:hypothetical protein SAY86_029382 [Trapa natans]